MSLFVRLARNSASHGNTLNSPASNSNNPMWCAQQWLLHVPQPFASNRGNPAAASLFCHSTLSSAMSGLHGCDVTRSRHGCSRLIYPLEIWRMAAQSHTQRAHAALCESVSSLTQGKDRSHSSWLNRKRAAWPKRKIRKNGNEIKRIICSLKW